MATLCCASPKSVRASAVTGCSPVSAFSTSNSSSLSESFILASPTFTTTTASCSPSKSAVASTSASTAATSPATPPTPPSPTPNPRAPPPSPADRYTAPRTSSNSTSTSILTSSPLTASSASALSRDLESSLSLSLSPALSPRKHGAARADSSRSAAWCAFPSWPNRDVLGSGSQTSSGGSTGTTPSTACGSSPGWGSAGWGSHGAAYLSDEDLSPAPSDESVPSATPIPTATATKTTTSSSAITQQALFMIAAQQQRLRQLRTAQATAIARRAAQVMAAQVRADASDLKHDPPPRLQVRSRSRGTAGGDIDARRRRSSTHSAGSGRKRRVQMPARR